MSNLFSSSLIHFYSVLRNIFSPIRRRRRLSNSGIVDLPSHLDLKGRLTNMEEWAFVGSQYADLRLGDLTDASGRANRVVVKVIRKKSSQEYVDNLTAAIDLCSAFNSPQISAVYGLAYVGQLLAIVIPFYPHGNVIEYIRRSSGLDILTLVEEIVGAVANLHNKGIPHGNIHGGNFLVDDDGHVVLTDVGLEFARNTNNYQAIPPHCRWQAPEILIPKNDNDVASPTTAADVYSLGLTLQQLYTLQSPFARIENPCMFIAMLHGGKLANYKPAVDMPVKIRTIIEECCAVDPDMRPTAVGLLNTLRSNGSRASLVPV